MSMEFGEDILVKVQKRYSQAFAKISMRLVPGQDPDNSQNYLQKYSMYCTRRSNGKSKPSS